MPQIRMVVAQWAVWWRVAPEVNLRLIHWDACDIVR